MCAGCALEELVGDKREISRARAREIFEFIVSGGALVCGTMDVVSCVCDQVREIKHR